MALEDLVPDIAVPVCMLRGPIAVDVIIDLICEGQYILSGAVVMDGNGIFHEVVVRMVFQQLHQWGIGIRMQIVVAVGKGDILSLSHADTCIPGIA